MVAFSVFPLLPWRQRLPLSGNASRIERHGRSGLTSAGVALGFFFSIFTPTYSSRLPLHNVRGAAEYRDQKSRSFPSWLSS